MIIVSACLLGRNCRYDGGNCFNERVKEFLASKEYLAVCPEQLGGLTTPRKPSEISVDNVFDKDGLDVTAAFRLGAATVLSRALSSGCQLAILKSESPSCGKGLIFDGSFSGKLVEGKGITAALLESSGIRVITEEEL